MRKEDRDCVFSYGISLKFPPTLTTYAARIKYAKDFLKNENITVASEKDIIAYEGLGIIYVTMTGERAMKLGGDLRVNLNIPTINFLLLIKIGWLSIRS
jgi:hypothetical protein